MEEQFYVVFPLFLTIVRAWSARLQLASVWLLWAISLLASIAGVMLAPVATFFLLPTRFWELATGSLLALGAVPTLRGSRARVAATWAGLALIGAATFLYDEKLPFPGLTALVPVAGAALVIWSGSYDAQGASRLLSGPLPVLLGKISYPLYLWHFPVFGFALYLSLRPLPLHWWAGLITLSLALAYLTFLLLETPVRTQGRKLSPLTVVVSGCAAMLLFGAFGLITARSHGFEWRLDAGQQSLARAMKDFMPQARSCMNASSAQITTAGPCTLGSSDKMPDTLIWGDSFAEAIAPGIVAAAERAGFRVLLTGRHGCTPQPRRAIESLGRSALCQSTSNAVLAMLASRKEITKVVLVMRWPSSEAPSGGPGRYDEPSGGAATSKETKAFEAGIEELLASLAEAGKKVWVLGPTPLNSNPVPRALYLESLGLAAGIDLLPRVDKLQAEFGWVNRFLEAMQRTRGIFVIYPAERLCDRVACKIIEGAYPLFIDRNHMSTHGALFISSLFDELFREGQTLPQSTTKLPFALRRSGLLCLTKRTVCSRRHEEAGGR